MKPWIRITVLAGVTGLAGSGAFDAATPEDFDRIASRLDVAGQALDAARGPEAAVEPLSQAIARYDQALDAMRSAVIQAGSRENAGRFALSRDALDISKFLAVLERVSEARRRPLDLHPGGPLAAARMQMMVAALRPELQAQADALTNRLAEVAAARQSQQDGLGILEAGLARLAEARADLQDEVRRLQPEQVRVDARTAAALVEAESLTALTSALGRDQSPADRDARPATPYLWPVETDLLRQFNERDAAGVRWPGIVLDAPPLSLVRAPAAGIVRYAGPFLDYRGVVVLETGDDALVLLAGMADLLIRSGERVERGAAVGMLGGRTPNVEEYVKLVNGETGSGLREALYVEIRHGRSPVDPVSWLDGSKG
jgi:murein hydrolase activator